MKKHYFRIEYSVRVLIGPADIRFELWFDDQKLSRDQSIKVDWTPIQPPAQFALPPQDIAANPSTHGRAELADAAPTRMSGAIMERLKGGESNGKIERTGTAIVHKETNAGGEEKKKRGMVGLMAKARGAKWSVRT